MKIAAVQFQGHRDKEINIRKASDLIRQAAEQGAKIICLPELFNTIYFCYEQDRENFQLTEPITAPTTKKIAALAQGSVQTVRGKFGPAIRLDGPVSIWPAMCLDWGE